MKKARMFFAGLTVFLLVSNIRLLAQEEVSKSKFNVGADLYSSFVWRGTRFGKGPSVQPFLKYANGGLTLGVWGAFDASGYAETDPYLSYSFPFGLSLGLTDYYYPGLAVFDFSDTTGSHALEINGTFFKWGLSLNANYVVNKAGGAASAGGDLYFQAGYSFSNFNLFAGAGNGRHSSDGKFALCNLGIGTTKVLKLTGTFSIPVNGQVILNPEREQLYVVAGFSF
jgi:hypothetical protein